METSSGIQTGLAGRYATALFALALESGKMAAVETSLSRLDDALGQVPEFKALTQSAIVSRGAAKAAVAALTGPIGIDELTARTLGVLADNRRLAALPGIIRSYRALAARHRGEIAADVTAAHPLTDEQRSDLAAQLRKRVGRDVSVHLKIDPSILGGLIVRIGSQMIDSSIQTRLHTAAQAMKG